MLNKPRSPREVAGDRNAGLIEVWRSLQGDNAAPFFGTLAELEYSEAIFDECAGWLSSDFGPKRAVGFIVRNRMSRGGLGKSFAWSERLRGKRRPDGPVPGELNAWDTFRARLPAVVERIAAVEFHCCDAVSLIRSTDGPDTLHYCDPPYLPETRTVRKAYAHEMTADDHAALLAVLCECRGAVLLSGYRNALYDRELAGWVRHDFDLPNHSGQGKTKQRRTECVWVKPALR